MSGKKRKPLAGRSGGSANQPSRDRRDSQAAANTPLVFPLRVNAKGELEIVFHSQGAIGIDPSRGAHIIVHPPLKLVPGSPYGISIEHDDSLAVENDMLTSSPSTTNVRDGQSSLDITLARLQATKQSRSEKDQANGYAGLDSGGMLSLGEIPPGTTPGVHAATHQEGGGDEVASATNGGAGEIPKALVGGFLDPSWFDFGTHGSQVCNGADARLSDSRAPNGSAGGDLTGTYPNPTIGAGKVTLAQHASMATASLFYRKTAGSGAPEVNTLATLKTDLGLTGTNSGDQTITLTGNVTGSGTGSFTTTIAASAVTLAMQANMATASLVYRKTAGSGAPEVNTLATLKTDLGLTGTNSGDAVEADDYSSFTKVGTTNFEAWHYASCLTGVATTTLAVLANKAYAIPFVAPRRTGATLDRIAINGTTPAGNARLALYDELNGIPVNLKTDYGVVAASGVSSITISQALTPGKRYFMCAVFDNTPTIRAISQNAAYAFGTDNTLGANANTHITATMTYGAWASTFPTTGMAAATGTMPGLAVRYSA